MAGKATKGDIILPVNMFDIVRNTKFHVVEGDMRYNALLGRPWIHNMRAVPSTLHQMMKFPTKDDIKWYMDSSMQQRRCSRFTGPEGKQTSEDDEEDFLAPRTFVTPEESDATKPTIEELDQATLIEHLPDRKE
ncbi:uncharacterized protein [Nicotiana sylvestris]|uniref:uncharacterized protein n=1 Tax=Nicotiana sylvestris TaxID=4096 RepID=UPI00388C9772